jgi:glycosyltransferase involved in cell wall biosynthesis
MLKISVIIPAYNVELYIQKAILSALNQNETGEVLIVNDGSTDDTVLIIENLILSHKKLRLLHHPKGENKGRSASRNLGIKNAVYDYISFLDADDFYLENRFSQELNLFSNNNPIDGVYNAIGVHFYRKASINEKENLKLTTLSKRVNSKDLFSELLRGKSGCFHLDGFTVKKSALVSINFFNESLAVMEDTELIWKLCIKSVLISGDLVNPVAMRGVHDYNVFNNKGAYKVVHLKFYESLFFWSVQEKLEASIIECFLERVWLVKKEERRGIIIECLYWMELVLNSSSVLFTSLQYKYNPLNRLRYVFRNSKS